MKLDRCKNGHFYDGDKFNRCPHCDAAMDVSPNVTIPFSQNPEDDVKTLPLDEVPTEPISGDLQGAIKKAMNQTINEEGVKTVSFFSKKIGIEPVVGWLVCVDGPNMGEDYRLKTGSNFIGRSNKMDIIISKDESVSRDKHGEITYEPRMKKYHVHKGEAKQTYYLNDIPIYQPTEIKRNDVLFIGETKLMFFSCCDDVFSWNEKEEDK